jgi:hypothetical protein
LAADHATHAQEISVLQIFADFFGGDSNLVGRVVFCPSKSRIGSSVFSIAEAMRNEALAVSRNALKKLRWFGALARAALSQA